MDVPFRVAFHFVPAAAMRADRLTVRRGRLGILHRARRPLFEKVYRRLSAVLQPIESR